MAWLAKNPEVVYTDLEDGAVLLNLETKFYYSLNESGQAIWRLIDAVGGLDDLVQKMLATYQTIDTDMKNVISTFLQELEREKLALPNQEGSSEHMPSEVSLDSSNPTEKKSFTAPELIKHDEPLHEVVMNPFDPQLPLAE